MMYFHVRPCTSMMYGDSCPIQAPPEVDPQNEEVSIQFQLQYSSQSQWSRSKETHDIAVDGNARRKWQENAPQLPGIDSSFHGSLERSLTFGYTGKDRHMPESWGAFSGHRPIYRKWNACMYMYLTKSSLFSGPPQELADVPDSCWGFRLAHLLLDRFWQLDSTIWCELFHL